MVKGVIFDLDNTLVRAEHLWEESENEIFRKHGFELPRKNRFETKGMPAYDAVKFWVDKLNITRVSVIELQQEVESYVTQLVLDKGELIDGAIDVLKFLKNKGLPLAIASSSPMGYIEKAAIKFGIDPYIDIVHSGDLEEFGKPHPAVYLSVANKLNIDPKNIVAFEDSLTGMFSVKAAKMKLVACLFDDNFNDTKYDFADLKIESFHNFGAKECSFLGFDAK